MKTTYDIQHLLRTLRTAALALLWMACATACSDENIAADSPAPLNDEWAQALQAGQGAMSYQVANSDGEWQNGNPTRDLATGGNATRGAVIGDGTDGYEAGEFGLLREFRCYAWPNLSLAGQPFITTQTESFTESPIFPSQDSRPEGNYFPGIAGSEANVVRYYSEQGAAYNGHIDGYVKTPSGYYQRVYEYEDDGVTIKTDEHGNYIYSLIPKDPAHPLEGVWHTRRIFYWPTGGTGGPNGENAACTFFAYYPKQATFNTTSHQLVFGKNTTLGEQSTIVRNPANRIVSTSANTSSSTMYDRPESSPTYDDDARYIDGYTDVLYCLRHQTAYDDRNMSTNLSRYPANIHFLHALSRITVRANLSAGTAGIEPSASAGGGYDASHWRVVVTGLRFCNLRQADNFQFAADMTKDVNQTNTSTTYDTGDYTSTGSKNVGLWDAQTTAYSADGTWSHNEWPATLAGQLTTGADGADVDDPAFQGVSVLTTTPVALTDTDRGYDLLLLPQTFEPWARSEAAEQLSPYVTDDTYSLRPSTKKAYIAVRCRIYDDNGTPADYSDDRDLMQANRWFFVPLATEPATAGGAPATISAWEPGKRYTYTLTFEGGSGWDAYANPSIAPISLTTQVTEWDETAPAVSATAQQQHTDPRVGDLYYRDGTWGPRELYPNKTAIGVVFSTSTTAADRARGYRRGYVVALKNAGSAAFATGDAATQQNTDRLEPNAPEASKDMDGLTHCLTAGNLPAIQAAMDYSGATAPATSSGWYLPSAGQLMTLYYNAGFKNVGGQLTAMDTNGNYPQITYYGYSELIDEMGSEITDYVQPATSTINGWFSSSGTAYTNFTSGMKYATSSENSETNFFVFEVSNDVYHPGISIYREPKTQSMDIRPVLAF